MTNKKSGVNTRRGYVKHVCTEYQNQTIQKESRQLIDTIMNKSMHSEDVRLKEIAKYKQMAIDYKLQIEKEMKEAAILKKKKTIK